MRKWGSWVAWSAAVVVAAAAGLLWVRGYVGGVNVQDLGNLLGDDQPAPVVISPASQQSVAAVVAALPNAGQFRALLAGDNLTKQLQGKGPYTVFVPVDSAFAALPASALAVMTSAEKARLAANHIVSGKAIAPTIATTTAIVTLSKDTLSITADPANNTILVGSSSAIQVIPARNGVVYLVNSVLVPSSASH